MFSRRRFTDMKPFSPITIVIPVYNRAGIVKRTLDSVAAQTFRPLSLVIVDNGSTDDTLQVLDRWKRENTDNSLSVKILSEPKPGVCNARNRGLEETDSPYLMYFDSDDVMSPGHVERAMSLFRNNPDADIVGWDVDCVTLTGRHRRLIFAPDDYLFNHIFHASLSTQRYACRTELFRRVGGWDSSVFGWNDYELGIRILLTNPKIIFAGKERTVTVHNQTVSITGTAFSRSPEKWEHSLDMCMKHLSEAGNADAVKWIEIVRAKLAGHYRKEGHPEEGDRLINEVLRRSSGWYFRAFIRFVYRFVACGGRGVAILVKLFM